MPFFAFISGYFCKSFDAKKLKDGTIKLLETYLAVQLIWDIVPGFIEGTFSLKSIILPHATLWYLVSLCTWRAMSFYLVPRFEKKYLLIFSVLACFLAGFLPFIGLEFSLSRTFVFYPFFLLGNYTQDNDINLVRSQPKIMSSAIILLVIALCYYFHSYSSLTNRLIWATNAYSSIDNDIFTISLLRLVLAFVAFIIMCCIINVVPDIKTFRRLGKDSMLFYIYHGIIIAILYKAAAHLNIPANPFLLLLTAVSLVVLIAIFSNFKISRIILNPVSYKYNRS